MLQQRLSVLFGRSGLGKSSLLNAGLIPHFQTLKEAGEAPFEPITIRFQAWYEGRSEDPVSLTRARLTLPEETTYLDALLPEDGSLWRHFKAYQALVPVQTEFVLLFDQFEELFSFPAEQVAAFQEQLAELLYTEIPQRYRKALQERGEPLSPEDEGLLYRSLDIRALLAIRSDRVHLLDQISGPLPAILKHRYHLQPLGRKQAEEAILLPAYHEGGFSTPRFDYTDQALDRILDHLQRAEGSRNAFIGSAELQIICQHVEQNLLPRVAEAPAATPQITSELLGDLSAGFRRYYEGQMAKLGDEAQQQAARYLIEEKLIFAEEGISRRLTVLAEQAQQHGVDAALLQRLVDSFLLRSEPDPRSDGYTYELSHDVLMEPILELRQERKAEEALAEERKAQAQALQAAEAEARLQRQKRRRATLLAAAGISLAALALIALLFAWRENHKARRAQTQAEVQTAIAEASLLYSKEEFHDAYHILDSAYQQLEQVDLHSDSTYAAPLALAYLTGAAQIGGQNPLRYAYLQAGLRLPAWQDSLKRQRRTFLLEDRIFWKAEYLQRFPYLVKLPGMQDSLPAWAQQAAQAPPWGDELGFYALAQAQGQGVPLHTLQRLAASYHELGAYEKLLDALGLMQAVPDATPWADSLGRAAIATLGSKPWPHARTRLRRLLQLDSLADKAAMAGGYPTPAFVTVPAGSFWMGSKQGYSDEQPLHRVSLDSFAISPYEVTVGQYCAFLNAQPPDSLDAQLDAWIELNTQIIRQPSGHFSWLWGEEGFPVVAVSWHGAVAYCRWLAAELGKDVRLPTEAQWEYAAAGGPAGLSPQGYKVYEYAGSNTLGRVGWHLGNAGGYWHPVGQLQPNSLGLYDLSGNAWEWCRDRYGAYASDPAQNPQGPDQGLHRVFRGGGWYFSARNCRVAYRYRGTPSYRGYHLGFRVALQF